MEKIIVNSPAGSANSYCAMLLSMTGIESGVKHLPELLKTEDKQIVIFRNPYDSILSGMERHFSDKITDLEKFDIADLEKLDQIYLSYYWEYSSFLEMQKSSNIMQTTFEEVTGDINIFFNKVVSFFNLDISTLDTSRLYNELVLKSLVLNDGETRIPIGLHGIREATPEREILKEYIDKNIKTKKLYFRYLKACSIVVN